MSIEVNSFDYIVGKTPTKIDYSDNSITFDFDDNSRLCMYHSQSCCEEVYIESIVGDLNDLIGHPILLAEERTKDSDNSYGCELWTFYCIRNVKTSVDIRWYGSSNGYYSVSVDLEYVEPVKNNKLIFTDNYNFHNMNELKHSKDKIFFDTDVYSIFEMAEVLEDLCKEESVVISEPWLFNTNEHIGVDKMFIMNDYGKLIPLSGLTEKQLNNNHNISKLLMSKAFGDNEDWNNF